MAVRGSTMSVANESRPARPQGAILGMMTTNLGNRGLGWYRLVLAILGAGLLTLWPATSASAAGLLSAIRVVDGTGPTVALVVPTAAFSLCGRPGCGVITTARTWVLHDQNWAAPPGAFLPTSTCDLRNYTYDCYRGLSPQQPGSASVRAPPQLAIHVSLWPLAPSACIRVAAKGGLQIVGEGFSASERAVAQQLASQGRNVVLRQADSAAGRTSDLLLDGIPYDVYTPTTGNIDRIVSSIASKGSQVRGGGVVLDLSKSPLTPSDVGNILPRVQGVSSQISDVIVLGGGG